MDSGAEISVMSVTDLNSHISSPSQPLLAANGSCITTYGNYNLSLFQQSGGDVLIQSCQDMVVPCIIGHNK